MSAFESHQPELEAGEGGSDRGFGLLLGAALLLVGMWPLWHHQPVRWWAMLLGLAFGGVALWAPRLLAQPKRLWMKFGWLLGQVVSPLVMGALLYVVVAPVGLVQRLFGRDALHLAFDRDAETYWQYRKPPGPKPDSMI